MKRLYKFLGRFLSTDMHIQRLKGSNSAALVSLHFLHERCVFQNGDLRGKRFENVNWTEATLATAHLENIEILNSQLCYAYLFESHLENANLTGTDFTHANMRSVYLNNAILEKCNFTRTNMARSQLQGANLKGALLDETNLWSVNLKGADLTGATLKQVNLSGVEMDNTTIMPDGTPWQAGLSLEKFTIL